MKTKEALKRLSPIQIQRSVSPEFKGIVDSIFVLDDWLPVALEKMGFSGEDRYWQEIAFRSHEEWHAARDRQMTNHQASGRYRVSTITLKLPFLQPTRWVKGEYEPIGERTHQEWIEMALGPRKPSGGDRITAFDHRLNQALERRI